MYRFLIKQIYSIEQLKYKTVNHICVKTGLMNYFLLIWNDGLFALSYSGALIIVALPCMFVQDKHNECLSVYCVCEGNILCMVEPTNLYRDWSLCSWLFYYWLVDRLIAKSLFVCLPSQHADENVDTTLLVHFFGKKGKAELNFDDFYR